MKQRFLRSSEESMLTVGRPTRSIKWGMKTLRSLWFAGFWMVKRVKKSTSDKKSGSITAFALKLNRRKNYRWYPRFLSRFCSLIK